MTGYNRLQCINEAVGDLQIFILIFLIWRGQVRGASNYSASSLSSILQKVWLI